jgi:hypothetical protein
MLAVLGVLGCGPAEVGAVDERKVSTFATVKTGLQGLVTELDDVGLTQPKDLANFQVDVFEVPPSTTLGPVFASTHTNADGFYELALAPADYVVCTAFKRCVRVTVPKGDPLRLDYYFSVGPGWSGGTRWP